MGRRGTPSLSYQQVSDKRSKLDPWKHGLCLLLPGGSPKDEYPWLRSASERKRDGDRTKARERRVQKREGNEKEGRPQVNQPGTLKEKSDGGTLFLEP